MRSLEEIINQEFELLIKMLKTLEEQKDALVRYDLALVEKTSLVLSDISKQLKSLENERINLIMSELKFSRKQAYTAKLSELVQIKSLPETIVQKKDKMREMIEKVSSLNSLNRLLTNRALSNLNEIFSALSNGLNNVCNVKV
ncbi:MAG: flagellar export chaperone FlgN [Candidatus Kapaibacteriota bacterium]